MEKKGTLKTNKRICFFLANLYGGGAERVMLHVAGLIAKQGYSVDLVVAFLDGPYQKEVSPLINVIDLQCPNTTRSVFKLSAYIREHKPIAVVSTLILCNILTVLANILSGFKTKTLLREASIYKGTQDATSPTSHKIYMALSKLLYPLSNHIIAVSTSVYDDIQARIPFVKKKTSIIYNPINQATYVELSQRPLDHQWINNEEHNTIVAVGRLDYQKGFDVLIEAFHTLQKNVSAKLVLLGEGVGQDRQTLETLVSSYGLDSHIDMPGFVDNPFNYMANADLIVQSSRWEGLPNVLIQALAVDTAVVATDCPGGGSEILNYGEFGTLVDVDDPASLAQAMQSAIENPKQRNAEELAKHLTKFDDETIASQYLELIIN